MKASACLAAAAASPIGKLLTAVLQDLAARGLGITLGEQFVEVALALASRIVVWRTDTVRLSGSPKAVRINRKLLSDAYL